MNKPYFVMLLNGESLLPLVDDNNVVMLFADERDARAEAENSFLGGKMGYEIFKFGI